MQHSRQSLLTPPGYPRPMRPAPRLLAAAALCLAAAFPTQAATVTAGRHPRPRRGDDRERPRVVVAGRCDRQGRVRPPPGLPGARSRGRDARGAGTVRLLLADHHRRTHAQRGHRRAGHASPSTVQLGTPVRVRNADVGIDGEGGDDRYLQRGTRRVPPERGRRVRPRGLRGSKARITRRLAERGYFDADFATRKVEVTRAENAADIDLRWNSGDALRHGRDRRSRRRRSASSATACSTSWCTGKKASTTTRAGSTACANRWRALDYFARIDIEPQPGAGGRRPRAGDGDADPGQARHLHRRPELRHRQRRRRAPRARAPLRQRPRPQALAPDRLGASTARPRPCSTASPRSRGSMAGTPRACRAPTSRPTSSTRAGSSWSAAAAARSTTAGPRSRRCTRCASAGASSSDDPTIAGRCDYRYASLLFPSLRAEYIDADDRLYPRDALGGTVLLRGGIEGVGSDAELRAGARQRALVPRPRRAQPPDRCAASSATPSPTTLVEHAAEPALLRRRRPQRPRLRVARDRPAHRHRRRAFALGAQERRHRQRRVRALLRRRAGAAAVFVDSGSAFNDDARHGAPASASACAGARRSGRCASTSRTASTIRTRRSQLHLNIGADL